MRILFVLHTFPPETHGGTELHVQGVAKILAEEHDVRVFCRGGDPRRPHGETTHGFQEGLLVARFNNLFEDYESFEWIYRHRASHEAFLREVESFRPDVVHIHHLTNLSTTIVEACKDLGLPVVFSLHDFWTVCPRGQRLHPDRSICETLDRSRCHDCLSGLWPDWFTPGEHPEDAVAPRADADYSLRDFDEQVAHVMELCDLVLTPSAFHREKMLEEVPLRADRIEALPHGLDHRLFRELRDPTREVRVIGYIGSVIPVKGVEVLVDAFNLLDEDDLELRVHGDAPAFHEQRDYVSELRRRVRRPEQVRFLGHYENAALPEILADIDILVVPSLWWETFSLTIREAMLAGVPVVASDIGAMKEALETTRAGLPFKTGDPGDLAEVLRRFIQDEDLRVRHANRRLEVKTLRRNAVQYLDVYDRARTISEERKGDIVVKRSSFPKKTKTDQKETTPRDLKMSIEKVGEGDVRVTSSVERGEQTRVSFVFDYGPSTEGNRVNLTIDFTNTGEGGTTDAIPASAEDGGAELMRQQSAETEASEQERAMYALDEGLFPEHVKNLDDMVETTNLRDEDQVPRTRSRDRGPKRQDRDSSRREEKPRRERPARARDEGPREERRPEPRKEQPERPKKPEPAKAPTPAREVEADAEEVVWGDAGSWNLPEGSSDPPPEAKRARNFRKGEQPRVEANDEGSFGDGL